MPKPTLPLPKNEYVTYVEVASYLGVSRVTVANWIRTYQIPIYKFDGDVRYFLTYEDACKLREVRIALWRESTLFPSSSSS